jgi:hypothetical protein
MARDIDYLKHLLELEYDHSQKAIDKFDEYRARLWVPSLFRRPANDLYMSGLLV